jgi:acetyltransferase-like isoleucine patch superfamily enzyme
VLNEYDIADVLPESQRDFVTDCVLTCSDAAKRMITLQLLPVAMVRSGYRVIISDVNFKGRLNISLGPGTGMIDIASGGYINLEIRMFRNSTLKIGEGTTINSARIICDHSDVVVGNDWLWSDEILLQSNDQHGIVDLISKKVINGGRRSVKIDDHVWIGRRAIIMPDVRIGYGSILGAGAILTRNMADTVAYAGVPARQVRKNVSWSRMPNGFSPTEEDGIDARRMPIAEL